MASKNPLTSPAKAAGSGGRDMVKDPQSAGSGIDFVLKPQGRQGKAGGRDFVASQDRTQPTAAEGRPGPGGICAASVPEGGVVTPLALSSETAPGNGGNN